MYQSTRSIQAINKISRQEGWALSGGGADTTPKVKSDYRLERYDEADLFLTDQQVWSHVIAQAIAGNDLHRDALACLRDHGPVDFARLIRGISSHQHIALIAIGLTMDSERVQALLKEVA